MNSLQLSCVQVELYSWQVDPYPHTFTSKLKPVNCVEKDTVEFDIETEASDAEVTWYQGNKKIVPDGERIIAVAEVNDPVQPRNLKTKTYSGYKEKAHHQKCGDERLW